MCNVIVAMRKEDYRQKMLTLLSDENTYEIVKKDRTNILSRKLKELLTDGRKKEFISQQIYNKLYNSDQILPGLPKIHKPGSPLRIIIPAIDSPLYSLAIFLHKIFYKISVDSFSYIKK